MQRQSISVRGIRQRAYPIGKTQRTFAEAIGVPVKTLRNWEQGRRKPTGPARVLLLMIEKAPQLVLQIIGGRTPAA